MVNQKLNSKISIFLGLLLLLLIIIFTIYYFSTSKIIQPTNLNTSINSTETPSREELSKITNQIQTEIKTYCLAIKTMEVSLCNSLTENTSFFEVSNKEECIRKTYLKKMLYENKSYCSFISETTIAGLTCLDIFNRLTNPNLEKDPALKQLFETLNTKDLSSCSNTLDPALCNIILNDNINCSSYKLE